MTIDPVASSIELYSKFLENAYLQASRSTRSSSQSAGSGAGGTTTSTSTTQATVNYALSVTVNSQQQQQTTVDPEQVAQAVVPFFQPTQLADPGNVAQTRAQLQRVRQGTIEPVILALDDNEASVDPLLSLAGSVYSRAIGGARYGGGGSLGSNLNATA